MNFLNRLWKWVAAGLLIIFIGVVCAHQYCYKVVSELKGPLIMLDAVFMSDGGSVSLKFKDSAGHVVTLSRTGSLRIPPSQQQMHVICWLWVFPMICEVPRGSPLEGSVKKSLKTWLSDKLLPSQEIAVSKDDSNVIGTIPTNVLVVRDFLLWLESRSESK